MKKIYWVVLLMLFLAQVACESKPTSQPNQDGKCSAGYVLAQENSAKEGLKTVGAKIKTVDKCMKICTNTTQCPGEVCHQFHDQRELELNSMKYTLAPQETAVPKGICVNINVNTFDW